MAMPAEHGERFVPGAVAVRAVAVRAACAAAVALAVCCMALAVTTGAAIAAGPTAPYTATETIPVGSPSQYKGSADGIGWGLALSPTQVFDVSPHTNVLTVACHEQSTAAECWAPETITDSDGHNFATSGEPGLYLNQSTGRLYVYATRGSDDTGGVVCIDTTAAPARFCGFTPLTPWYRDGTPLAGVTASTYRLGTLDQGTTIHCTITGSNQAGSTSATSRTVMIPIHPGPHCAAATETMTATRIGLVALGLTRARVRRRLRDHSDRGQRYEDFFCLAPIGIRVGYPSPALLRSISSHARAKLAGTVVWASTANPYYALDGVRAGESITAAARALGQGNTFAIGGNDWYVARGKGATAVLKVRQGVVQEVGIADDALTATRASQRVLMGSFS